MCAKREEGSVRRVCESSCVNGRSGGEGAS